MSWKCTRCDLCLRANSLPPVGYRSSDIMLIFHYPNYYDNKYNNIVGSDRGKLVLHLLNEVALTLDNVYITSAIKCRPTITITDYQSDTCSNLYLKKELNLVKPKIIVVFDSRTMEMLSKLTNTEFNTLGNFATTKDYVIFRVKGLHKALNDKDLTFVRSKFSEIISLYKKYINPYHLINKS